MKTTTSLLLILFLCFRLNAQEEKFRNFEIFWTAGFAEMNIEETPVNENGDYLNFFNTYPDGVDLITSKLGLSFDFFNNLSTEAIIILTDDLFPDNFDLSFYYNPSPKIGIGVGSMLYKNWITSAKDTYLQNQTDYHWTNGLARDFKIYDWGFYVTPTVRPFYSNTFKASIKFKVGLSSFSKLNSSYSFKRINSNERRVYTISTSRNFQPFINPSIQFRLKLFKIKSTSAGLICNSAFFCGKRSIDYQRSVQIWTSDNISTQQIKSDKHKYSRSEWDFGLYMTW